MTTTAWPQRVIEFTHWENAEDIAAAHLLPAFTDLGLTQWSFVRKHPTWRLRFQPTDSETVHGLDVTLHRLAGAGDLRTWTTGIYEPETHAFGGPAGTEIGHAFFHDDSLLVLQDRTRAKAGRLGRRELALLLPSVAMRAAGLDWYEQGDVWAKVAAERLPAPGSLPESTRTAAHRLMTVDCGPATGLVAGGRLAYLAEWIAACERLGQGLAHLNQQGELGRGIRAVLAHHVIFHWNRLGLVREDQNTLSTLAKEAVMGMSEHTASTPKSGAENTTVGDVNGTTVDETAADRLRTKLVDELVTEGNVHSPQIEQAMRTVPRHLFVPDAPLEAAYSNAPVNTKLDETGAPISCASQPDIVGMMLEQLDVQPGQNVLELGAGTGFNAALLGHLVGEKGRVTTIDVDEDIVAGARAGLAAAGITNVTVILGDGAVGHLKNAPYDRIEATVGAHAIPGAWLDQLAPGGRLLTPIRLRGSVSRSIAFERQQGAWRSVGSAMNTFMPLRRGIADDPRVFVPLVADGSVQLVTNGDQKADAEALADVLHQPRTETWTGVNFRGPESAEWLELWLTCTMPNGLSRMPAQPAALRDSLLSNPYPSSTAVFEGGTLTYLTRRKATATASDGATLHEFGVIGHGPGATDLTERVVEEVRWWDREFRGREVVFEIQALTTELPAARPGRFALDNGLNRLVIEWQ
ncbi:methyltransferase, FxLD system [Streptomyces sp. NBC_00237]|uniref:methyltransferase, FxLD system n=1 Tax=Streptomyces sp. NBC_00237 TaxID=2975687 RepID=UPI00224EF00A|nr:methyltransferase, FxLD system [Streptomyces sp. NBC_00237]MCX5206720.1 methyltransferase, FxLD system [Streptomyces sp. NBC_00237]